MHLNCINELKGSSCVENSSRLRFSVRAMLFRDFETFRRNSSIAWIFFFRFLPNVLIKIIGESQHVFLSLCENATSIHIFNVLMQYCNMRCNLFIIISLFFYKHTYIFFYLEKDLLLSWWKNVRLYIRR